MSFHRPNSVRWSRQSGQAFLAILILIAILLLVMLGVAADYTQVWAHRQMAQGAADAACEAGVADMFLKGTDPTAGTDFPGLDFSWIGTGFNCAAKPGTAPCQYASINGYTGSNVSVSFPTGFPGVASIPSGFPTVANPYIKVTITDPVALTLTKLVSSTATFNLTASAGCGLMAINTPVPLVVLHRTASGAISVSGSAKIKIFGGPQRSIQVDSGSATAVSVGTVDLSHAGPTNSGSDFAVFGGPTAKPAGVNLGTTGNWLPNTNPFGDPFAAINPPASAPSTNGAATPVPFAVKGCPDPNGCVEFTPGDYSSCLTGNINPGQKGCLLLPYTGSNPKFGSSGTNWQANHLYSAGTLISPSQFPGGCTNTANSGKFVYIAIATGTSGSTCPTSFNQTMCVRQSDGTCTGGTTPGDGTVTWQNVGVVVLNKLSTGIFDPGLYYVAVNGLRFGDGSTARISTATGDGSHGVTFYFSTSASASVTSNSGKSSACTSASSGSGTPNGCVVSYKIDGALSSAATGYVPSQSLQCPSGSANPSQVPAVLDGNILLGPCSGTYASPDGNRGFLFFQNRSAAASASWGGGGQFLSSGFMYFHNGNGATCGTNTSCLTLQGSSGSQSYTLGNIVVDKLSMGGSPQINMILNSKATFSVLRPTLLQ
jgi:putative Flp pilus-assembly TadE/G-like protein